MQAPTSLLDLALYFLLYAFLGWTAETVYYAIARRRFCNRGILSLPFLLSYGLSFCILILVLPSLNGLPVLQFLTTLILTSVSESLAANLMLRAGPKFLWGTERERLFTGSRKGFLQALLVAGGYYFTYLLLHPLLMALLSLIPGLAKRLIVGVFSVLLLADLFSVLYTLRTGGTEKYQKLREHGQQSKLGRRLTGAVWHRLQRAYPGIREKTAQERELYLFAKGLCLDKLIWVFFTAALLGDIIETLFCGFVDGQWMNRSSVLYGPFSFVWGLGAVVLTITLQPLVGKSDRYVFLAGFFIGGVYEYMCSVFTELVFGTVFWDYSEMPLNIGGRTNVLFCFFWGVLALVWVKILYPPLSRGIERLPALTGKVLTWVLVFYMLCNAFLTGAAMLRYHSRAQRPESRGVFEDFLDRQYGDAFMEERWPNMIVTQADPEEAP